MSTSRTAIIVAGGGALLPWMLADIPSDALVIAADSGLDHARAAGLHVDMVVGDLDSVTPGSLAWARSSGIRIDEYPRDKDATDTELALRVAAGSDAPHIVLLGGGGDRLDHTLGAITALGHSCLAGCASVVARWGDSVIHVIHGPRRSQVPIAPGATFSVLSLHGPCEGVTLQGARWELANSSLQPASSVGVSNEALSTELLVRVEHGVLSLIIPTNMDVSS